jgi:predicted Zn-dependent protease
VNEQPVYQGTLPQQTVQQPVAPPQNSTVRNISSQADQLMRKGKLDAAAQTLERGIRIAPKNAYLWSQLATVRLKQHRYGQAQSLAAKSSSLAKGDSALVSRNQAIIDQTKQ